MIDCPFCSAENIEGADVCDECGEPLGETYLSPPDSDVERSLLRDRVDVLEPRRPVTVSPRTPVGEVLRMMVERRIGCVVVAENWQPVGIFSERDALRQLNTNAPALAHHPVSEFMTPKPQTLVADAKVAYAVQRMDMGSYRHLPIVDEDNELVGIISARDILGYLTRNMRRAR